jgi:DNA-binding transcriptional LysR family regulator
MDFRQIRYLVAVADAGSFTAGARRAFVTQPTLSAAIAALEKELGSQLFERGARGVTLTAEGQRALAHARQALNAIQQMRRDRPVCRARLPAG